VVAFMSGTARLAASKFSVCKSLHTPCDMQALDSIV
jgi:hypothetical protein